MGPSVFKGVTMGLRPTKGDEDAKRHRSTPRLNDFFHHDQRLQRSASRTLYVPKGQETIDFGLRWS